MNQKEYWDRIKLELNRFPAFLKSLVKRPLQYVDSRSNFDWTQILLYTFLVQACVQVVLDVLTLNLRAILGSLIFVPIQTLVIVGFFAFAIWFVLDRFHYTTASFLDFFKAIAFIEMIVSVFAVLLIVVAHFLKIFELFYVIRIGVVLVKCILFYRALTRQLAVNPKRSFAVTGFLALIFLLPHTLDFMDQFNERYRIRAHKKQEDRQMEESIKAIEQEFNTEE